MKYLKLFFLILSVISCNNANNTKFTWNKGEAENKINTEGYRDGKWIDYYDNSNNRIADTNDTKYTKYRLMEFSLGKPINTFRMHDKQGNLIFHGKINNKFSIAIANNKFDFENLKLTGELLHYNSDGEIMDRYIYDSLSRISINYPTDVIPFKFDFEYHDSSDKIKKLLISDESNRLFYDIDYNSSLNFKPEKKLKQKLYNLLFKEDDKHYELFKDAFISKDRIFYMDKSIEYSYADNKQNQTVLTGSEIKKVYNIIKSDSKKKGRNNVKCEYCGKNFDKRTGYYCHVAETDIKKWDGSVINMMNKALPNYDKSLEYWCSSRCSRRNNSYKNFNSW
jgi:hypothetical protein